MERADERNAGDRVGESGKPSDWLEERPSVPTIPESPGRKKVVSGLAPLHLAFELNGTMADFVDNGPYTAAPMMEQPSSQSFMSGSNAASEQGHARLVEKGMMPEFRGKSEKFQNESEPDFPGLGKCPGA